ncbi:hypothetical protein [Tepidibacter aestuarii]|uniref:hypothetical protein n=1 Tax=Tepidibacter aestuarii TaxID=2925782 RepID=UPI0020BF9A27|nr:hypothetical protein [Tepidibacter aestuarii]CAH2213891.1 conserved protein of unknown function [Tepidibacter aestuarii]
MENLHSIFIKNNFELKKETSKAIEYENIKGQNVVYLIPNKEISIVLNPDIVEVNAELKSKSNNKYHSTALTQFPKRKNNGEKPIHYGYSFKFETEGELDSFLKSISDI